ncbi:hypothetical protein LJB99_02435 [Deltaproteobacteria bacterium OttesenSCG-928-K17]|nr:hypothetical protein [Deltaproteobacteria bacterium OttesenSCG-928-K17]
MAGQDRKVRDEVPALCLSCLSFKSYFVGLSATIRIFSAFIIFFKKILINAEKFQMILKSARIFQKVRKWFSSII